jgi:HK97 family phage portal protein
MKAVASVPARAQVQTDDGAWVEVSDQAPLPRLIEKPNPLMSWQDMNETIVSHLDLGGNAIVLKVEVRGVPAELWVLRPDCIKPVLSSTEGVSHYEYRLDGRVVANYKPEEIIHFRYIDPSNEFWGISPLMAGGKTVDMEVEAVNWNKATMQNRAVPDGMISMKVPLSKTQFNEANAYMENQLLGPANARRPFVLGYDAKYERFSLSPAELDFIESRRLTREEICGMFAVPPPLVGIYDKATLANIETARVIFWLDTIVPLLDDLADVWTFALAPDFGPNIRIVYDTTQVQAMQTLLKEKIESAKILSSMGVPFNEINQRLGLGFDDLIGGDIGYLPATVEPTLQSANADGAPIDFDVEEDDEEESED